MSEKIRFMLTEQLKVREYIAPPKSETELNEKLNYKDSAYAEFQQIIDMKRKSPRHYVIRAHAKQAQLTDPTTDTIAFLEKYAKLLKDRENRPYLDVLNYQIASFYDKLNQKEKAVKFYNKSLRSPSEDTYLQATTYKNLATIYFDKAKYLVAGQYYDSTLTKLVKKDREYFSIVKKRENLVDVIRYEGIVQHNDSILKLVALSDGDKKAFFEDYIAKMKVKDEAKRVLEEKQKEIAARANAGIKDIDVTPGKGKAAVTNQLPKMMTPDDPKDGGAFYFYTPTTVAYGKIEFQKRWGKRALKDNWRWSVQSDDVKEDDNQKPIDSDIKKDSVVSEKYKTEFY